MATTLLYVPSFQISVIVLATLWALSVKKMKSLRKQKKYLRIGTEVRKKRQLG